MANTLVTPQFVVRRALDLFRNANAFLKNVGRDYEDKFGNQSVAGQKPGSTIGIRLPNDYVLRTGPTAVPQPTNERQMALTVAKQVGVDVAFSMVDRTMSLQDYSERIIEPAVNVIAGGIASDLMSGIAVPNLVHNVDGSNNTISPTLTTWATAGALLDKNNAPRERRKVVLDPITMARTVSSFSGLFNNQEKIGNQYSSAMIGRGVLGMDWMQDQTVVTHATGAYGTAPKVNGASQTGSTITVTAVAGSGFKAGDVITMAGVYAVNRVTKASTGQLRQFTVTADVAAGATSIPIYPALIPGGAGGAQAPYQTVLASPADQAQIVGITNASETYRQNFVFVPEAVTLAIVPLEMPTRGVMESYRDSLDGVSMRLITFYDGIADQAITRLDVLYGSLWVRPEWACIVPDAL
jgi:hypothetical protein